MATAAGASSSSPPPAPPPLLSPLSLLLGYDDGNDDDSNDDDDGSGRRRRGRRDVPSPSLDERLLLIIARRRKRKNTATSGGSKSSSSDDDDDEEEEDESNFRRRFRRYCFSELPSSSSSSDAGGNGGDDGGSPSSSSFFRRLLATTPSAYEIPWKCCREYVRCCSRRRRSSSCSNSSQPSGCGDDDDETTATTATTAVRHRHRHRHRRQVLPQSPAVVVADGVSEIRSFLLRASSRWYERERRMLLLSSSSSPTSSGRQKQRRRGKGGGGDGSSAAGDKTTTTTRWRNRCEVLRPAKGERVSARTPRYWILQLLTAALEPLWTTTAAEETVSDGGGDDDETVRSGDEEEEEEEDGRADDAAATTLLALASTIVTLGHDSTDASLSDACLSRVFFPSTAFENGQQQRRGTATDSPFATGGAPVRPELLAGWTGLAAELPFVLRDEHMDCVRRTVGARLREVAATTATSDRCDGEGENNKKRNISSSATRLDFPKLAEAVTSLSAAVLARNASSSSSSYDLAQWQCVLLRIITTATAAADFETVSAVETAIKSSLAAMPSTHLRDWIDCLMVGGQDVFSADGIPNWTLSNLLLLGLRASSRQPGQELVSLMVREAMGVRGGETSNRCRKETSINEISWFRFVDLAFPPSQYRRKTAGMRMSSPRAIGRLWDKELRRILKGVSYVRGGKFENDTGVRIDSMTEAGKMVWDSLFPGLEVGAVTSTHQLHALERANAWTSEAVDFLEGIHQTHRSCFDSMFAAVVIVTVFSELPDTRHSLVQRMLDTFVDDGRRGTVSNELSLFYCTVISLLLESSSRSHMKTVTELDRLSSVFPTAIPLSLFLDLSFTLSPLASVRLSLLRFAEKRLDVKLWSSKLIPTSRTRHSDDVKCGIQSLIVLSCATSWDKCETEAWSLLSDLIVTGKPVLPVAYRSWLFESLEEQLSEGRMGKSAAAHFLRACISRILYFVEFGQFSEESFLPEKAYDVWSESEESKRQVQPVEDLPSLLRLVLALFRFSFHTESSICIEKWQSFLCAAVLRNPQLKVPSARPEESTSKMPFPGPFDQDIDPKVHALMYCIHLILQHITRGDNAMLCSASAPSCASVQAIVVDEEIKALSKFSVALPKWLRPTGHGTEKASVGRIDRRFTNPVCRGVCSTLCGFLLVCGPPTGNERREVLLAVSSIYEARRQLSSSIVTGKEGRPRIQDTAGNVIGSLFSAFCSVLTDSLDKLMEQEAEFESVDRVLAAILDICDDVYALPEAIAIANFQSIACSTQKLFAAISGEMASRRLIAYFEKAPIESRIRKARIGSVSSPDDIDTTVREVRTRVVRVLLKSVPALASNPTLDPIRSLDSGPGLTEDASVQVLLDLTEDLLNDLNMGVHGKSGGLSYDLFDLYLDCLGLCTDGLESFLKGSTKSGYRRRVASVCGRACHSVAEIMSSHSLAGKAVLTKSLTLMLYVFPSLARLASRHAMHEYANSEHWGLEDVSLGRALDQCSSILKGRVEKGIRYTAPWEHAFGDGGDNPENAAVDVKGDSDTESCNGPVSVISLPKAPSDECWLQISSERSWIWMFSSTLQCVEWDWEDSFNAIQDSDFAFSASESLAAYMKHRNAELVELMDGVSSLLEILSRNRGKNEDSNGDNLKIALVILPESIKLRLLALIDRVLMTLQEALKTAISFIREPYKKESSRRIDLIESFCCLSSLLVSNITRDELTTSIRDWYASEVENLSILKGLPQSAQASLCRKLPQTVTRTEELECLLRSFSHEARNASKKSKLGINQEISSVEEMTDLFALGRIATDDTPIERIGILSLVERKLEAIERARTRESEAESGRKRRAAQDADRRVKKERRKRHIRSRNQVVDKWLRIDQQVGRDETVEDDAYDDLEDFLVEG